MEEIIDYVMKTPENTNGNILREKLQKMGGSGGGAVYATFTEDSGTWSCDKTYAELKAAYDAGSVIVGLAPRPGRTEIEAAAILIYNEAYNMFSASMSFYSGFNSGNNSAHLRSWVMGIMSSGGVDTVFVEYHDGDIEVTNFEASDSDSVLPSGGK